MASTASKSYTENLNNNTKSVWTFSITGQDVVASGSTFNITTVPASNVKAKYVGSNKGYADARISVRVYPNGASPIRYDTYSRGNIYSDSRYQPTTSGTAYALTLEGSGATESYSTSNYFNSSNSTSKTVSIYAQIISARMGSHNASYDGMNPASGNYNQITDETDYVVGAIGTVTLNAPPTYTATVASSGSYYAGVSQYRVTLSSVSAKYGGTISQTKLTVGNQSVTGSGNGTLTINLSTVGTFTPTVVVTDSRGQKTIKTLSSITVNSIVTEIQSLSVQRVDTSGKLSDDGTNACITAKFNYTRFSGNYLVAPVVKVGGTTVNTVTWYTSWSASGGFSSAVNWTNYYPSTPITLYGRCTSTFNINNSYTIGVTPKSTNKTGTEITRQLLQAFYLLAGRAGGHALGIGIKPLGDNRFDVNLEQHAFKNINIEKDEPSLCFKSTSISSTVGQTIPSSNAAIIGGFYVKDKNDYNNGWYRIYKSTGDSVYANFAARRSVSSSDIINSLTLGISSNGTRYVSVSEAAPWRSAIGAVNIGGDTMTGSLRLKCTDRVGTRPSEAYYSIAYNLVDADGVSMSYYNHAHYTSGTIATQLGAQRQVNGEWKYNTLLLNLDEAGNAGIGFGGTGIAAAWRMALDLSNQIIVRAVTGTIGKSHASAADLTAPTVSGYKFVAWIYTYTYGWVGSIATPSVTSQTARFWLSLYGSTLTGTGDFGSVALYIRNP